MANLDRLVSDLKDGEPVEKRNVTITALATKTTEDGINIIYEKGRIRRESGTGLHGAPVASVKVQDGDSLLLVSLLNGTTTVDCYVPGLHKGESQDSLRVRLVPDHEAQAMRTKIWFACSVVEPALEKLLTTTERLVDVYYADLETTGSGPTTSLKP